MERTTLKGIMKRYCSAKRIAFNSLLAGRHLRDVIHSLESRRELSLNWRYCEHAARDAAAEMSSRKELLVLDLASTYDRIQETQERIDRVALGSRKRPELQKRLDRLHKRRTVLERHMAEGTLPGVVFGSRKLLVRRAEGKVTNEEWRRARDGQLYSIGQGNQGGNANIRVAEDCSKVGVNVPEWLEVPRTGRDGRRYGVKNVRRWFRILVVERRGSKARAYMRSLLSSGRAYSVRLVEDGEGRVHVQVSSEIHQAASTSDTIANRVCSLDQNPFGVAAAVVSRDGNLLYHRTFYEDRLIYASQNKRDDAIGELVRKIIGWAHERGAHAFVIEDLDIRNNRDFGRRVNRVVYNFVRKKFAERMMMKCWKEGNAVFTEEPAENAVSTVSPAYTSKIGRMKYREKFGLSVHEAAALCIGRRYYGFGERLEEPLEITVKHGRKPRERVPVRYVSASLYGRAKPRDPYMEPPRRKGGAGENSAWRNQAVFTGRPASERTAPSESDEEVRKGGERGGSPRVTGNGVKPASPATGDGKVSAAS